MAHDKQLPVGDRDDYDWNQPRLIKEAKVRNPRRYTLFLQKEGHWLRIGAYAFGIEKARLVYQRQLVESFLKGERMELRAVTD